jgi:hypothetical protein
VQSGGTARLIHDLEEIVTRTVDYVVVTIVAVENVDVMVARRTS